MEPTTVIIWVCVAVFVITAILTILHVSGIRSLPNPRHGEVLFKALVVEVVVISIVAFSSINKEENIDDNASISDLNLKLTDTEKVAFNSAEDLVLVSRSSVSEPCLRIQSAGLALGRPYGVNWDFLDDAGNSLKNYQTTYTATENPEAVYSCRKSFFDFSNGSYEFKVVVGGIEKTKKIEIVD